MLKAYRYRLVPNSEQEEFFIKTFGCVRKVYNLMLNDRIESFKRSQESGEKIKLPTPARYKKEFPFLKEVDSLALANAQLHLNKAYQQFFKRPAAGFPKWKSRKNPLQSYTTNNQNGTIAIVDGRYLKLPKMKPVRIKLHRHPRGMIKSATISQAASGKFYVSILCETDVQQKPKTGSIIGMDLGLTHMAVLSDSTKILNPKHLAKTAVKLAKAQRKLSHRAQVAKKQGRLLAESRNYQKQRIVVAKLHEKIAHQRNDYLHKRSTDLVNNHDVIFVESLNIQSMVRHRRWARSLHDVSWSSFLSKLTYKATWYGKQVIPIRRWFASSQICSVCGHQDGKKELHIREWSCPSCGVQHDRDVNASLNIRAAGLRLINLTNSL
ncbi:IS200/IS605 family element RNA-guided endonuclease TnpB [Paenibacillus xylanilyticus]|uniref:IS200/IS605 family element transposase accessory protein TnpB n=1 Tax=Paenibacillus xylanilyticus TaxID=248903 RepID=A0A7Y6EUQ7_9BACL|nr:IS200/IS605 family element RNA-guided endonuclease TnpB [Paenibacillus xylanilyticus]NUU74620.1 IS200/IS605 family element transposase accessory protein TnpB [Paenibacillus xylanilyticus]